MSNISATPPPSTPNTFIYALIALIIISFVFSISYFYITRSKTNHSPTAPNEEMNTVILSPLSSASAYNESIQNAIRNPKYLKNTENFSNNPTMSDGSHPMGFSIVNYFILSSFNSCIYDIYTDQTTVLSLQALGNVLTNGFRLLDFELYLDDTSLIPIVASSYTSWSTNGNIAKPIINTTQPLNFVDVMNYIVANAFRPGICSNSSDPLIINLRINTYETIIYKKIADILKDYIKQYPNLFLPKNYTYIGLLHKNNQTSNNSNTKNKNKNVLTIPFSFLNNRIIIFASALNENYLDSALIQYINNIPTTSSTGASTNPIVNINPISQISLDDQLTNYNKFNLSIVYPDTYLKNNIDIDTLVTKKKDDNNNEIDALNSFGIQCICVMHYKKDSNHNKIIQWFNKNTAAFVLKDKSLRDIPRIVNIQSQDPKYSFKPMDIKLNGINEKIDI